MSTRNTISAGDFIAAAGDGALQTVRQYIENGGNVNATPRIYGGRTALYNAAYFDRRDILKYLLEQDADPTIYPTEGAFRGDSVLYQMISHHNYDIDAIRSILERGADPNRRNQVMRQTPVGITNNPEVLKLLFEHGGNPDEQQPNMPLRADILAQELQYTTQHSQRPWPQWLKDQWTQKMQLFELFCRAGSTAQSCEEFRTKESVLQNRLPENITKRILQNAMGGKRLQKKTKTRKAKKTRKHLKK